LEPLKLTCARNSHSILLQYFIANKGIFCFRGQRRKLKPEDFTIATETPDDPKKLTAVNLQLLKSLWLPDVEILNLKTFETLTVLSKLVSFLSTMYTRDLTHAARDIIKITQIIAETKALRYKLFFLKALMKWLWKLTIKTRRLSRLKSLSFLNFNN